MGTKCGYCRGKIGIIKYECKCSSKLKFCIKCRLPESHECTYDFKNESKLLLEKQLVKVEHEKVIKI